MYQYHIDLAIADRDHDQLLLLKQYPYDSRLVRARLYHLQRIAALEEWDEQ